MQPEAMARTAQAALADLPAGRKMVALAGPPAAGKTTVSRLLCDRLNADGRSAVVLPMDGFHLDNRLLETRGLLDRKGAPETFDAAGFARAVARAAAGEPLVFPVFDRRRDIAIAGAGFLPAETEFVLVEGNYLLLDTDPWAALAAMWDFAIWIDAPEADLEQRLVQRWRDEGLDEAQARARAVNNDLPNAQMIMARRGACDLHLSADPLAG